MHTDHTQSATQSSPGVTRIRRTREEWIAILDQYRQSNCSQSEFCRDHNLSLTTFNKWVHRLKTESASASESAFVAVTTDEPVDAQPQSIKLHVRLTFGNGAVLDIHQS